jgi:Calpain family cysteine protease
MPLFTAPNSRRINPRNRARLAVEQLERRDLLSAPSVMTIANAEYAQDSMLTRTDVIDLLETVAGTEQAVFTNGKVSFQPVSEPGPSAPLPAQSLSDLRSIVANPGQWGMTADVADLAGNVVGYNLANEHYKYNTLLAGGKLAPNDPAYMLSDLIGKWFLGNDEPAIPKVDTYRPAHGTLFGPNGPKPSDIAQGAADDCYFLSNLGEAALQSPQTITNMFIDNGDGTYTVRFFEDDAATNHVPEAQYVTVDRELPVNSGDGFVYANRNFDGASTTNIYNAANILWVALAEKAYAQLAEEGWSRGTYSAPVNSYASLDQGENLLAGKQITGKYAGANLKLQDDTPAEALATMQILAADFAAGDLLTDCSLKQGANNIHVIPSHVYFVTAIDISSDSITLTNPYMNHNVRTVTLKLDELIAEFGTELAVVHV